jgi:hypothetical protein
MRYCEAMAMALLRYILALFLLMASGCGYTLQSQHSKDLEKEGIRKIFISPVVNNTYHSGIDSVVYNALLRSLSTFRGVTIVQDPENADAVLSATINQADSFVSASVSANNLAPANLPNASILISDYLVATQYNAVLGCSFNLLRRNPPPGKKGTLWAGSFNRSQLYQASNQLSSLGTTSPLINDSEFDRTILSISHDMMIDVREAMLARF